MNNKTRYWHALYTKSRAEKKVHTALQEAGFESYLPLHKVTRKWSDRIKVVEMPLISSYVFVYVNEAEYYDVLNINGAVAYVTFEGKAAKIRNSQIEALKISLDENLKVEVAELNLSKGQPVKVVRGPLKGLEGKVVKEANKTAFVIDIVSIQFSLYVTVDAADIERL